MHDRELSLEVPEGSSQETCSAGSEASVIADARRSKRLKEDSWQQQWIAKNAERHSNDKVAAALARA
jgi:hypothetical protein